MADGLLVSVDGNEGVARLEEPELLAALGGDFEPLLDGLLAARGDVVGDGVDALGDVQLPRDAEVRGDGKDGRVGAELGNLPAMNKRQYGQKARGTMGNRGKGQLGQRAIGTKGKG